MPDDSGYFYIFSQHDECWAYYTQFTCTYGITWRSPEARMIEHEREWAKRHNYRINLRLVFRAMGSIMEVETLAYKKSYGGLANASRLQSAI